MRMGATKSWRNKKQQRPFDIRKPRKVEGDVKGDPSMSLHPGVGL